MDSEWVFRLINLLPMPVWLTWMVAPHSAAARWLARSLWPFALLAGVYTVLLVAALLIGPGEGGSFASLDGVMALFRSEWGVLAGWAHYLCFDLFVARWIVNDAPDAGYKLLPILVFTLMAGPFGLLLYLIVRRWLPTAEPRRGASSRGHRRHARAEEVL